MPKGYEIKPKVHSAKEAKRVKQRRKTHTKKLTNGIHFGYYAACQGLDADIDKDDMDYIRGFQLREAMHLSWNEYMSNPKWVNDADYILLLTRGKASEEGQDG